MAAIADINIQFLKKPEIRKAIEEQTAFRRIGQTTDVANVAAFLLSDDNTWVTGQYIEAGGGFRL